MEYNTDTLWKISRTDDWRHLENSHGICRAKQRQPSQESMMKETLEHNTVKANLLFVVKENIEVLWMTEVQFWLLKLLFWSLSQCKCNFEIEVELLMTTCIWNEISLLGWAVSQFVKSKSNCHLINNNQISLGWCLKVKHYLMYFVTSNNVFFPEFWMNLKKIYNP